MADTNAWEIKTDSHITQTLNTPKMKAKRLRQIEKGMIQVTPERNQPKQEASNAGNS